MSEGFGVAALLSARLMSAPPEVQRPKSQSTPLLRPKAVKAAEQPRGEKAEALKEPMTPPAEPAPLSAADREAEQQEFAELLEPLPEPDPPPASPEPPRAQPPPRRPPRFDPDEITRDGFTVAVGVGASLCGHDWCDSYRGGFAGQLELGFRFARFMPHVSVDGGGGGDDRSVLEEQLQVPYGTLNSSRTSFFGVGAGLTVFFSKVSRLDPYATARLGYSRTRSRFGDYAGNDFAETVSRGSFRLGGGLDVFIGRNVAFGPRFDVTAGFAGQVCAEQLGAPETKECFDARNLEETARIYTQDLPVPVFVGAQIRGVIAPWW